MKPKSFVKRAHLLEQKYSYIEMPYCENGDLFGLIEQKDGLVENTARYFSHQSPILSSFLFSVMNVRRTSEKAAHFGFIPSGNRGK